MSGDEGMAMFESLRSYHAFLAISALSCLVVWGARLFPGFAPALLLLRYGLLAWALYDLLTPRRRKRGLLLCVGILFGWLGGDLDLVPIYARYDAASLWLSPLRFVLLPCFVLYVFCTILRSYAKSSP